MKSILLHVQDDDGLDCRIDAAVTVARTFDGHITCLHATPYREYLTNDPFTAMVLPVDFSSTMERVADDLRIRVEDRLRSAAARWDWIHVDNDASPALVRRSPLADLVVMSLGRRGKTPFTVASVAATGRAPVLAIPASGSVFDPAGVAAIAWDGSGESSVALRASLPLLRKAAAVHLIEIDDRTVRDRGEHAAPYLSRHGIDARIIRRVAESGDVGGAILEIAAEANSTLLVMGAYGHSRTAEFLLGGATQAVLANAQIPLLLAH